MATLYTNVDRNIRKTWFLMAIFLVVVIAICYAFSYIYDDVTILYFGIVFSLVMNLFSYYNSDKIAIFTSGAKLASVEEYKELHRVVENLSITAGLPKPKVFIIDDPAPNAFATGRDPSHSSVAVTRGLLQLLDKTELEGVLAHELSHIGNRDILVSTVAVVLVGFIALISDIFIRGSFMRERDNRVGGYLVLVGVALAILSPIVATLIQLAISRKREFLADSSGALLTRYPEGLANALKKISESGLKLKRANHATAHLFISNPFGAKAKGFLNSLFMTHPPLTARVEALLNIKV